MNSKWWKWVNLWKLTLFLWQCESCSIYISFWKCYWGWFFLYGIKKGAFTQYLNSSVFFMLHKNILSSTDCESEFGGLIAHQTCFAVTSWMSVSKGIYRRCSSSFIWASKAQSKSLLASAGTPALNKAGSEGQGQYQDG